MQGTFCLDFPAFNASAYIWVTGPGEEEGGGPVHALTAVALHAAGCVGHATNWGQLVESTWVDGPKDIDEDVVLASSKGGSEPDAAPTAAPRAWEVLGCETPSREWTLGTSTS